MEADPTEIQPAKPICVGLTCWRWESKQERVIVGLAQNLGVTIHLTRKIRGLRREIEAQVSGQNIDRFIGEFVRRC